MQYLRRLKRKKGFTITELIVVVALVGIMMATLTAFSGPVRDMVGNTRAKNDALKINNIIGNYLEHNLSYASQVTICAGWDLIQNNAALKTKFEALKSTWTTANDRPAAIIIHFEKDDDTPLRNTFRLYEYSGSSAFPDTTTTDAEGNTYMVMDEDNLVFHKDFYADYSFVITADDIIFHNSFREKGYAKLEVQAYNFDGSVLKSPGVEATLEAGDTKTHYMNIDGVAGPGGTVQQDILTSSHYLTAGIGNENVFFPLQNINVSGTKYEYFRGYEDPTTHVVSYGDDIVIFYNIRTYTYGKSSS